MTQMVDRSVAVIIPYFNGADYISIAVQSVLHQTVLPDEIIIIDDGSDEPLVGFQNLSLPVRILRSENFGQSSARNIAAAMVNSRYICFLDQDDEFLENHIEILRNALSNSQDCPFAFTETIGDGKNYWKRLTKSYLMKRTRKERKNPKHLMNLMIYPSATLIDRKWFEFVGGFDLNLVGYEDDDLFIRMIAAGGPGVCCDQITVKITNNPQSASRSAAMDSSRVHFQRKWQSRIVSWQKANLTARFILIELYHLIINQFSQKNRKKTYVKQVFNSYFDDSRNAAASTLRLFAAIVRQVPIQACLYLADFFDER
jgi:glycosyltransferase involved in cell wall biosynthesis